MNDIDIKKETSNKLILSVLYVKYGNLVFDILRLVVLNEYPAAGNTSAEFLRLMNMYKSYTTHHSSVGSIVFISDAIESGATDND